MKKNVIIDDIEMASEFEEAKREENNNKNSVGQDRLGSYLQQYYNLCSIKNKYLNFLTVGSVKQKMYTKNTLIFRNLYMTVITTFSNI